MCALKTRFVTVRHACKVLVSIGWSESDVVFLSPPRVTLVKIRSGCVVLYGDVVEALEKRYGVQVPQGSAPT